MIADLDDNSILAAWKMLKTSVSLESMLACPVQKTVLIALAKGIRSGKLAQIRAQRAARKFHFSHNNDWKKRQANDLD